MAIENEDHLRYVYDCLLPGNPYTADVDEDDCCVHGILFEEDCRECEEDDTDEEKEEEDGE